VHEDYYPGSSRTLSPPRRANRDTHVAVHIALFAATFATAAAASAFGQGFHLLADPGSIVAGFPYAITLMSILVAHEFGHYSMARVHRVDATLPYFIPAPPIFFIGTFGAFIRMRSVPENRRALFDIGAAGPWGGFLVAVPALIFGLQLSEVIPTPESEMSGLFLGDSLLMKLLQTWVLGVDSSQATVNLHPIAMAAWVGFLVTALNLLPVGQLDGGHVVYAVLGETWHRWISRGTIVGLLVLGLGGWPGWIFWVALLALIGLRHPRTEEMRLPLNRTRMIIAALTAVMFVSVFMPEPIFERPAPIVLPAGEQIEV
jgi:membrane-associated protease RseP (regulator of RpoE activity)